MLCEKKNLLLFSRIVNVVDLENLNKKELIEIIIELNIRLSDVMQNTEWLKEENERLGNLPCGGRE